MFFWLKNQSKKEKSGNKRKASAGFAAQKKRTRPISVTQSEEKKKTEIDNNSQVEAVKIGAETKADKSTDFSLNEFSGNQILLRPIVTEKSVSEEKLGKYVFEVAKGANKISIKKAIKRAYKVTPIRVNIINNPRKYVKFGARGGYRKALRKAIVTLKKGEAINVYSQEDQSDLNKKS